MKLVRFAALVAGAGVAQVLAVPFMVIPNNVESPSPNIRLGHAVPMREAVPQFIKPQVVSTGRMRVPCGGRAGRFHQKSVEISNLFRQTFGLPLIQAGHHSGHNDKVRILPFIGGNGPIATFAPVYDSKMEGGVKVYNVPDSSRHHPRPHHVHHHHRPHHHRFGNGSFVTRVHSSLMNLGRWEGRAVAFVLGCGIGVLLRMLFVFAVVMYRAVKGQRGDEHEYSQITIIEEVVDSPKSSPPTYTYPVDEKAAVAVEAIVVPTTTEQSK